MTKTTFDLLPYKVDQIYEEIMGLKAIIEKKNKSPTEQPQYLDIGGVVKYLEQQGYKISRSSIYKFTAKQKIPYTKFLGKLIFNKIDIQTWAESSIKQEKLCHNRKQKRK